MKNVNAQVQLPRGYRLDWEGEYESEKRAQERLLIIVPITILLIFIILYSMFRSPKWATLILATVAMASIGGLLALLVTGTHFSVSSGVGFLALFGVSVQRHYARVHQPVTRPRLRGGGCRGRGRRPAATPDYDDHVGRNTRIVACRNVSRHRFRFAAAVRHRHRWGLMVNLAMSIFILPTLYVWLAKAGDKLPEAGNSY
jgi:cobalt-zinc-cadmium resistance protein CzcA